MDSSTYAKALALFVTFPNWSLEAACELAVGRVPGTPDAEGPNQAIGLLLREAAFACFGYGLSAVNDDLLDLPLRVEPRQFAYWAREQVPGMLHPDFVSQTESLVDSTLVADEEGRKPSSQQEAKYRCRGLAAYFWSREPNMTITEMANRPELRRFGCPEMATNERQRQDWIRNLAPSPKSGRPKKRR